jgi:DNA helicase II / ATP-dependent DNA helicase PcrA
VPEYVPTEEQALILDHNPEESGCIEAGPGTGKSATLVALIEKLLSGQGKKPKVRLLTFTRAATAELADKVGGITTAAVERPSTIHSFAISVLVRNPGAADYPEPLRMADDWENDQVIRPTLARRMGVPRRLVDALLREMEANWEALVPEDDPDIDPQVRARFIGTWQEHRRVFGYTLLSELPNLLRQALIDHPDLIGLDYDLLVVDEYQDLNACDMEVLRRLADRGCAILAAGDEDQSIYSFRKAAPEGIRRFTTDYPGSRRYPLTVTKRCGKEIVRWARWVIEGDPDRSAGRTPLTSDPDAPDGEVGLLAFTSQAAEATGIADLVEHLIKDEEIEAGQILVLFRADRAGLFSKPIKERLESRGIPIADPDVVKRGLDKDDNRWTLELARLMAQRDDSIAWASLLALTPGVGNTFVDFIYHSAATARISFAMAPYQCL